MEHLELAPQAAVIAPLGLGEAVQVGGEVGGAEPGGAVDPLELGIALVAAPVDPGDAEQLDGREGATIRDVRSPAEVEEGAGAVDAHAADVRGEAIDDRDLELLPHLLEETPCLVPRQHLALIGDPPLRQLTHPRLDGRQVSVGEMTVLGEQEVVEEAVLDRRTDIVLGPREELADRCRHEVGGAVPEDVQGQVDRGLQGRTGLGGIVDFIGHGGRIVRKRCLRVTRAAGPGPQKGPDLTRGANGPRAEGSDDQAGHAPRHVLAALAQDVDLGLRVGKRRAPDLQ